MRRSACWCHPAFSQAAPQPRTPGRWNNSPTSSKHIVKRGPARHAKKASSHFIEQAMAHKSPHL
eukprot:1019727-Amphidinium_carterae.1